MNSLPVVTSVPSPLMTRKRKQKVQMEVLWYPLKMLAQFFIPRSQLKSQMYQTLRFLELALMTTTKEMQQMYLLWQRLVKCYIILWFLCSFFQSKGLDSWFIVWLFKVENGRTDDKAKILQFPLFAPKDVLDRLALPPPKDLDLMLLDSMKPSSSSKGNLYICLSIINYE